MLRAPISLAGGGVVEQVRDRVMAGPVGFGQLSRWSLPSESLVLAQTAVPLPLGNQILELSAADLVVTVGTGMTLRALNEELAAHRLCLPYWPVEAPLLDEPLISLLGYNLPHLGERRYRSWREWILGATIVTGTGRVGKFGSRVVKSVAGYDGHKLFVGARGTLAVVAEVHLRLYPLMAAPQHDLIPNLIHRVPAAEYANACATYRHHSTVLSADTSTIFAEADSLLQSRQFPGEFRLRAGCGDQNFIVDDPAQVHYWRRARDVWDPENRLNPGALAI